MGCIPSNLTDAHIFFKYILATKPEAKIGVLYQNDATGKGYQIGLQDVLGAKHGRHGDQGGLVQGLGAYGGLANRHTARLGRRRLPDRRDAEGRRPGDPQGLRHSLDPFALPGLRLGIDRIHHEACGPREIEGRDRRNFRQGRERPALEGRSGGKGLSGVPATKYLTPTDFIDGNAAAGFTAAQAMVQVLKQCGDGLSRRTS